jgi:hypothetical protein
MLCQWNSSQIVQQNMPLHYNILPINKKHEEQLAELTQDGLL